MEERIRNGMKACELLEQLGTPVHRPAVRDQFNSMKKDIRLRPAAETLYA